MKGWVYLKTGKTMGFHERDVGPNGVTPSHPEKGPQNQPQGPSPPSYRGSWLHVIPHTVVVTYSHVRRN